MGEAGILALGDEAVGWRAKRRPGETLTGMSSMADSCGVAILQLLSPNQSKLVNVLGKKTGWDGLNKREECATLGNDWVSITGRYVFLNFHALCLVQVML